MKKRLLFLDLDGTLLNDAKEITPGNREALERTLKRGHGVIITTGRPLTSAMHLAARLGLDKPGCYVISYNGAMIYDWGKQETMQFCALDIPTVIRVFQQAKVLGQHVQTYDAFQVLVEPDCDDEAVRRYCKMVGMTHRVIQDVRTDVKEEPVKCLVINYQEKTGLLKMQDWIRAEMPQLDCYFSCEQFLEVVPKGMNKGTAVRTLCRMLNVEIENAVAAGDAANDLAMLGAAGIGAAMINGTDEVKAIADFITTRDNNHDGVAEIADRFFYEDAE